MMLSITVGAMVKIAILIAFAAFINTLVKCLHDTYCKVCKK
jgi:hypothetical protein